MDSYYPDKGADEEHPCEVRIGNGEIVLSAKYGDTFVIYSGKEIGEGHFKLEAPAVQGRGTLHGFPGDDQLVGTWAEGRSVGMWRITLGDEE